MTSNILAGVYRANVTPPVGGPIAGGFDETLSDEIADELFANALVLADVSTACTS